MVALKAVPILILQRVIHAIRKALGISGYIALGLLWARRSKLANQFLMAVGKILQAIISPGLKAGSSGSTLLSSCECFGLLGMVVAPHQFIDVEY